MVQLEKLQSIMEELAPAELADQYDAPYFLRLPKPKLTKIGVCIDPTEYNLRQAMKDRVDLLITHHPWHYINENLLKKGEMGVYVLHSPWYKAPEGITATLARLLNLKEVTHEGEIATGYLEMSFRNLIFCCQRLLQTTITPYAGDLNAQTHKVLIISGPGFAPYYRPLWNKYIDQGCDTFLSAELGRFALSYLTGLKIKLIDLGHSAMARPGMEHLAYLLQNRLKVFDCEVCFYPDYHAVNYLTGSFYPEIGTEPEGPFSDG